MNREQRRGKINRADALAITMATQQATNKHAAGMLLAASCLALNEAFGFDREQCITFLENTQTHVLEALCAAELANELSAKLGIDIISEVD
jgi:hypothetical protein